MGFFSKNTETEAQKQPPRNPSNTVAFRLLAIGYLGYLCVNLVNLYKEGGADAPSLPLLIGGLAVLGGGAIFLAIISYKEWKRGKVEYDQYMAELRAEAEAKRAAEEAAEEEDEERLLEEASEEEDEERLPEGASEEIEE